jgi:hypothetical protein
MVALGNLPHRVALFSWNRGVPRHKVRPQGWVGQGGPFTSPGQRAPPPRLGNVLGRSLRER